MSKVLLDKSTKLLLGSLALVLVLTIFSILSGACNPAHADDLDYSITIEPSLNVTTSATDISLNLNPANHPFDTKDLTVSVGTNNETGYKLILSTIDNTTNLVEQNDNNLYIETLSSETDQTNFPGNRWGYKLDATNTNYLPFIPNILISSSDKPTPTIITNTLSFAAKANYNTKAGTYNLALNFQALANPKCNTTVEGTMQEFDPCPDLEDDTKGTLTDIRDGATYTVAKINGNWWMTQNLRYKGDTGSASNSMTIKAATSNVSSDMTMSYTDLTSGNTSSAARIHNSGNTTNGIWYNYAAASAGSVTDTSNPPTNTPYDICPKNWHLPTNSELDGIVADRTPYNLVTGGIWYDGGLKGATYGHWWSATNPVNGRTSYLLDYNSSNGNIRVTSNERYVGRYVRCIRSN